MLGARDVAVFVCVSMCESSTITKIRTETHTGYTERGVVRVVHSLLL